MSNDHIEVIDLNSIEPPKKRRGRPAGAKNKKKTVAETEAEGINLFQEEEDLEAEKRRLKEKLLQYSDYNPELVTKPINDKISKLVNEMDIDELRARCRQGKKLCSSRVDTVVGQQIITLANQSVGSLLDCVDELHYSTRKDQLLQETTTRYFSLHLLDYIPDEIKMAGLYGSHVLGAYYQAEQNRKGNKPVQLPEPVVQEYVDPFDTPKPEEEKTPEPVSAPALPRKDIEVAIKPIQETRDKLIRMNEDLKNLTNH